MSLTFTPVFGWIVSPLIAVIVLGIAVYFFVRNRRLVAHGEPTDATMGMEIRRIAMAVCVVIMLITPSTTAATSTKAVNATNVFVAVDVTGSMAVSDAHYKSEKTITRITAASKAIKDIAKLYSDASFSAVRFGASTSVDLPLTPDSQALVNWGSTLVTEPTNISQGSSLSAPLKALTTAMKKAQSQHPNDTTILYYISDGENTSAQTRETFSTLRKYVDDAVVVGVGSTTGSTIPLTSTGIAVGENTADATQWVQDPSTGENGISAMNVDALKEIADELSGKTVITSATKGITMKQSTHVSKSYRLKTVYKTVNHTSPIIWPFVIILMLLVLWEIIEWIKTSRRLM